MTGRSDEPDADPAAQVVVIGAGPRGVGLLERVARNLPQYAVGPLIVHLVDPYPPGPGRIWRRAQSPLLKLNSMAEDVTMFTDTSSTIAGPVAPGPSLIEWAIAVREGRITDIVMPEERALRYELVGLQPHSFPTRRLHSLYLDWFYRRARAALDGRARVVVHDERAEAVEDGPHGRQLVRLASGKVLAADVVVYALGHAGSSPHGEQAVLRDAAAAAGLFYLPPSFTADTDLGPLTAGEPVIVRGMGLAAVDLVVLLTQGRGGSFRRADGVMRYVPSGREPHILMGSRRGVPYHSKITSTLQGVRPEPRFFTTEIASDLATRPNLDFTDDIWPLIAKEMLYGYFAELFTGHPERVRVGWEEFAARFADLDVFGPALRALVAETVRDPGDRLDLSRFGRPLEQVRVAGLDALQHVLRSYIRNDLDRRTHPRHSATLGLFQSLLQALFVFIKLTPVADWSTRSRERDLEGWWLPYFSYVASGPPGHRLEELLALSEAGVVTFLGAGMQVGVNATAGVFHASGMTAPGVQVTARSLVDAWLPHSPAAASDNSALRDLVRSGAGVTQFFADGSHVFDSGRLLVNPADSRVMRPDGRPHPRRFAIGPYTSAPFIGAFARPHTDAVSLRENDTVARAVLALLAGASRPTPTDLPRSVAPFTPSRGEHELHR